MTLNTAELYGRPKKNKFGPEPRSQTVEKTVCINVYLLYTKRK